jgi:hypothetical protein
VGRCEQECVDGSAEPAKVGQEVVCRFDDAAGLGNGFGRHVVGDKHFYGAETRGKHGHVESRVMMGGVISEVDDLTGERFPEPSASIAAEDAKASRPTGRAMV